MTQSGYPDTPETTSDEVVYTVSCDGVAPDGITSCQFSSPDLGEAHHWMMHWAFDVEQVYDTCVLTKPDGERWRADRATRTVSIVEPD